MYCSCDFVLQVTSGGLELVPKYMSNASESPSGSVHVQESREVILTLVASLDGIGLLGALGGVFGVMGLPAQEVIMKKTTSKQATIRKLTLISFIITSPPSF